MPRLSIIVPIYNVEKYLAKCLDSLLSPAADYEILLVNDGSTDSSAKIIADFSAAHPELVRVFTTPNGGLGHARNVGIENARGDYLLFVDSDDYLSPGAVEEILAAADGETELYLFDAVSVNELGEQIEYIRGFHGGELRTENLLTEIPAAWNKLYKRSLFTETGIRYPDRVWFEDLRTTLKLYPHAKSIRYLPKPWYNYLQRPGSITNAARAERNTEILPAFEDLFSYYRNAGLYEENRSELEYLAFYHILIASGSRVIRAGGRREVLDRLISGFGSLLPGFSGNPHVSVKDRLLAFLIRHRCVRLLRFLFRLNARLRHKSV